jgi:hypothetical protein
MNEKKARILFLLLGFSIGIIVGASVVRLYSDKVNAENTVSKNFVTKLFSNIVGLVYKGKKQNDTIVINESNRGNVLASTNLSSNNSDSLISIEKNNSFSDTIDNSSMQNAAMAIAKDKKADTDETILSEQYFASKRIEILDSQLFFIDSLKSNKSDKLKSTQKVMLVEFWQNPLNYKGYKLLKNKIALYGLSPEQNFKILKHNNALFLHYQKQYICLKESAEFQNFERCNEPNVIQVLQKMSN